MRVDVLVVVFSCVLSYFVATSTSTLTHVAFVFAGSIRSFNEPPVHLSIRHNLIDGFCPAPYCVADVFARISSSDNTHGGLNAVGTMKPPNHEKSELTKKALHRLSRSIHTKFVDIGSDEEKNELSAMRKERPSHRIYQDLDPRRYNMYFNRWSAYQMAVEYEKQNNIKFDWIVHARLDFLWTAPIRPYSAWSSQRVWVPDSWATDVPDTFAILPRTRADLYYSLDALYDDPHVGCLGGPDFDPKTASDDALTARGYDAATKVLVNSSLCLNRFSDEATVVSGNVGWSWGGVSEIMLKRKMRVNGVDFGANTLGFTMLPTVMVREPLNLICHYAGVSSFIPWPKEIYNPTAIYGESCLLMNREMNRVRSLDGRSYGQNCDLHSATTIAQAVSQPMTACILDFDVTDWNFMPFRIRGNRDECLTGQGNEALLQSCADTSLESGYKAYYDKAQLFFFYPLTAIPQRILHGPDQCLTVGNNALNLLTTDGSKLIAELELKPCALRGIDQRQMFRIAVNDYESAVHVNAVVPLQASDLVVVPSKSGSTVHAVHKQHLPDISVVEIVWLGLGERFCVTHRGSQGFSALHGHSHHHSAHQHAASMKTNKLFLVACNATFEANGARARGMNLASHFFILERTKNRAPIDY